MNKFTREFRLIPVVLFATVSLLARMQARDIAQQIHSAVKAGDLALPPLPQVAMRFDHAGCPDDGVIDLGKVAFDNIASKTGCKSPGELEITFSTSEVAVCC